MSKKKGKRKRGRSVRKESYARLKRRARQGPLDDYKIIVDPKGQVKMSEVLEAFVEPYLDGIDDTLEMHRKLFSVAALAWNAALLPERERQEVLDDMVEKALGGTMPQAKREFRDIVRGMIERKLALFAENKRTIIDFELTPAGRGYHLTVMATVPKS